jgi:hypothetical protein
MNIIQKIIQQLKFLLNPIKIEITFQLQITLKIYK